MKPKNRKKKLAARIADYFTTVANLSKGSTDRSKGYSKPGSNSK